MPRIEDAYQIRKQDKRNESINNFIMNEMLKHPVKQRKTSLILKKAMTRGVAPNMTNLSSNSTKNINLTQKQIPSMNSSGIQSQTMGNGFKMF